MEKRYVPVTVHYDENGKVRPLEIEFAHGEVYTVDKIKDCRRAACESVGGVGIRYTCMIKGKEAYLWQEKDKWFVAVK